MKIQRSAIRVLSCMALVALALPLQAAEPNTAVGTPSEVSWVYPVIKKFGGVHPRLDAEARPDPNVDYKILVDVVSASSNKDKPYPSLDRLARLVNLMAYAKVPPERVHIVALLDGAAGAAGLTNAASQKYLKKDNPNLEILHALKKAGVKLFICSQSMAARNMQDSDIDPSVSIALSALTVPAVYEQQGYSYMQL